MVVFGSRSLFGLTEGPEEALDGSDLLEAFLVGLDAFGVVFLELKRNSKQTKGGWERYLALHEHAGGSSLAQARRWLDEGAGVGFLPRGSLWVLDVDSPAMVDKVCADLAEKRRLTPWTRTPSGGAHFYFRWPPNLPLAGLKHHLCHPMDPDGEVVPCDLKMGPRTLLVAPGTRTAKGLYEPATPWMIPAVIDPRFFVKDAPLWREQAPFLVDPRPEQARVSRACVYLRRRAPVSICGCGGRKTLLSVCSHLVVFLGLSPALAQYLLTHGEAPWNSRCRYLDYTPYPWSSRELRLACEEAVDTIPAAGVQLWKRNEEDLRKNKMLSTFLNAVLESIGPDGAPVPAAKLKTMFEGWSRLEVTPAEFGRAATKKGLGKRQVSEARVVAYVGIHLDRLHQSLAVERCS